MQENSTIQPKFYIFNHKHTYTEEAETRSCDIQTFRRLPLEQIMVTISLRLFQRSHHNCNIQQQLQRSIYAVSLLP